MIRRPRFISRRAVSFAAAAAIHLALLFLAVFTVTTITEKAAETSQVMKLADIREIPEPQAPRPARETVPDSSESIAETMIESDDIPPQTGSPETGETVGGEAFDFLPMHLVSKRPEFPDDEIIRRTVYPPMAQRAGIEGTVILELFVDRLGVIRNISILKEDPPDRGFGEAAARAFQGLRGSPALANGEAVASRYRYRYQFRLR
ncbi:MAG: energy transducer TonB [Treponema sp.]|jgi:protein TonB|nr:energy transducer TonB [Treponema sp.]